VLEVVHVKWVGCVSRLDPPPCHMGREGDGAAHEAGEAQAGYMYTRVQGMEGSKNRVGAMGGGGGEG
jgi:hypothetical protein